MNIIIPIIKRLPFITVILLSTPSIAQESNLGNWMIYFGNKKFNDNWNLHHEIQYRNYNVAGDLEQLLIRSGIGYNLSENNNNLLAGYGYILSSNYVNPDQKDDIIEHRIYQQFITAQVFGRFSLTHRYRFEQRFIESNFKLRFRYFISVKAAINNATLEDKTLYLSAYSETFLSGESPVFDRNRLYGGLGFKLNSLASFELGYMNQVFEKGGRDQVNVIVSLNF